MYFLYSHTVCKINEYARIVVTCNAIRWIFHDDDDDDDDDGDYIFVCSFLLFPVSVIVDFIVSSRWWRLLG